MKSPIEIGIIRLKDFPQERILVGLREEFKKEIFKHIKRKNVSQIGIIPSQFYNFRDNEKITIKLLFQICSYLTRKGFKEFSHNHIEKNISIIGTKRGDIYINDPNLPFNFNNEEGAYFISAILFDGGIDRQYKPHYGNRILEQRKRIVKCVEKIFGKINSREVNSKRGPMVRFPKSIGIILNYCFDIGIGNKMYNHNKIPEFIFKLNKKNKGLFLKQAFDDDGWVTTNKYSLGIVGASNVEKECFLKSKQKEFPLLNGIKKLLINFKIETNPTRISKSFSKTEYRRKGEFYRYIFTFSITGRENLEKFYKEIGFNIDHKMERLKEILGNYKVRQLRKGEIHKIALEECKNIRGNITIPLLAKKINRTYRQTVRIVREFEGKKLIKQIKPSVNISGRRLSAIYKTIER